LDSRAAGTKGRQAAAPALRPQAVRDVRAEAAAPVTKGPLAKLNLGRSEKRGIIFDKETDPDCDPGQYARSSTERDHKDGPGEALA